MIITEMLINVVVGLSVVFAVLIILMACIAVMSKFTKKKPSAAPAAQAAPTAAQPKPAKGSCGSVKLFDVPDKTAAMLMAITAEKMNVPLNTLRFISIKEVK
ncbi:MAG: hypothetical protein E7408_00595 [Ruminococcaceae bacterium]|nr:hypothetical protein [Oscillospiraceae bacterium]